MPLMASTSMEMSAAAKSRKESARQDLDESVAILKDKARVFARLSAAERAALLRSCIPRLAAAAPRWAAAGIEAKGILPGTQTTAEEWLAGPVPTIRNARLLARALDEIAAEGKPRLPKPIGQSRDGTALVDAFPSEALDAALYSGFTCKVRMLPGLDATAVRSKQASFYDKKDPEGAVSLVLGAGNVSSIPPMDAFYKMFVDGSVCLLKMNPVNEYLGPIYEDALEPLISAGYLRIVYGAGDVGAYLTTHEGVDDIHITGSDRTHDLIVWGPPGPERDRRKAAKDPLLKKTITSELGSVTPVIMVPGDYSASELEFLAQNVASMVTNNASCNCNAAKMIITSAGWPQRETFLARVREILSGVAPRKAYYPGAFERFEYLVGGRKEAVKLGKASADELPWTLCFGLDSKDEGERLFNTEPFCPILSETSLDEKDPAAFLKAATAFANDRVWGTLSAVITIHPRTEKDPAVASALDDAVQNLRYGAVGINHWTALVYATGTPPWGAHPSATLENIQGGLGWVHNTLMLEGIEKAVLRGPHVVKPKPPWFVTNKNSLAVAQKMVAMEAAPSWLKVPGIALAALSG
ncbi:Aldehyde dehydrogenase [Minicystis rosea]|nr:Aldehyde dehydrogenase [Minicystis rosea]